MNIKSIENSEILKFANSARLNLQKNDFIEYLLPLYTDYSISNVKQIKTETNNILRTTTEPEIWITASDSERFFCITNLFRNENPNSYLHKEEFKIIDFYKKESSTNEIIDIGFGLLKNFEKEFNLIPLSTLDIKVVEYENFKDECKEINNPIILNVTNYPLEESFYDEINPETGKTLKGELFFVDKDYEIEFSVYGKVSENMNPSIRIRENNIKKEISNNLFGMCFGFERVLMIYKILNLKWK